jgi:hypothetical protein
VWLTSAGQPFTGEAFEEGAVYKARVTLTPAVNYTINTTITAVDFIHTNATAVVLDKLSSVEAVITITFKPAGNAAAPIKVTFSGMPEDETITLTKSTIPSWSAGGSLTISVSDTFEGYVWYRDGVLQDGEEGNSLTLLVQSLSLGSHTVTVKVETEDGEFYSKIAYFTIGN